MIKRPKFSATKNYIIPLMSVIQNDTESINRISESLETRGYAFVRLPNELVKQIDDCLSCANSFFHSDNNYKKKFFKAPVFGHFSVQHKESFRILTGSSGII